MITEYVLFSVPPGMTRDEVVQGMRDVVPKWRNEKDLIRKTFIYRPRSKSGWAFYLWNSRQAAEHAHDQHWRQGVRARYGSEPAIRYFDTPIVVDNALGQTIEGPNEARA